MNRLLALTEQPLQLDDVLEIHSILGAGALDAPFEARVLSLVRVHGN
jgi:hypothetical protein